jgi:hypothetical protein
MAKRNAGASQHHPGCRIACAKHTPCQKNKRHAKCSGNTDADELPFRQIENDLGFLPWSNPLARIQMPFSPPP